MLIEFKHFVPSPGLIPQFQVMSDFAANMFLIVRDFDSKIRHLDQAQEAEFNYAREALILSEKYPRDKPRGADYAADAELLKRRDFKSNLNKEIRAIYDIVGDRILVAPTPVQFRKFIIDYIRSKRSDEFYKYLSAVSHGTIQFLVEKLSDGSLYKNPPTHVLCGSVDGIPRIYVVVTPLIDGQEHIYIFRDPILDFLDEVNGVQLVKGLALPLHIYGLHLFKGLHLYTTPLKVMTDMLNKQKFLLPIDCHDGCPGKNDPDSVGNSNGWLVDYSKIPSLDDVAEGIAKSNKDLKVEVVFDLR